MSLNAANAPEYATGRTREEQSPDSEWPPEMVAELRRLWATAMSTVEIGKQLGVSKSAVTGKAHRLKLDPRPSPIRRELTERSMAGRVARDLAVKAPLRRDAAAPSDHAVAQRKADAKMKLADPHAFVPDPSFTIDKQESSRCAFPLWGDEKPTHRYCGYPVSGAGSPYCKPHRVRCSAGAAARGLNLNARTGA